jgi:hypothetical protein
MTGTPAPYVRHIEHLFRARLTAKSDASGEWRYAWTEQRLEAETGSWVDAVPPRLGTLGPAPADDRNYATELSGLELPAQGELYWMLLKDGAGGELTYEVQGRVASSHSGNVGDGSSTAITVTHNLGTEDVVVVLIRNSDGHCVNVAWRVTGVNTIVLDFGLYAPALDEYRVTVLASGGGWSTNVVLVYDAVNVSYVNSTVVNYTTSTVVNYTDVFVNYTNVSFAYLSDSTYTIGAGVTLFFVGLGLGGNLNFANLSLFFGSTVNLFFGGSPVFFTANTSWVIAAGFRLTVNGPGVLVLNLPVKMYDGWWLHYRDIDLTGESQVDDLNLPAFPDSNRVVCRVMIDQDCVLTGMIPTLDGGAGQVIILINDNPLFDLTLGHAHAGSDAQNRFFCPCSEDLVLCFNAAALVWYDPDLEKHRVIGFCCDKGVRTEGTLAAAGSSQGDAAPVVTDGVFVTGADDVKGVVLESKVGALTVLYNDSADSLKVYPPSTETLEPLAADAPEIVLGFEGMVFARTDAGEWAVINRDIFAKVSDSATRPTTTCKTRSSRGRTSPSPSSTPGATNNSRYRRRLGTARPGRSTPGRTPTSASPPRVARSRSRPCRCGRCCTRPSSSIPYSSAAAASSAIRSP